MRRQSKRTTATRCPSNCLQPLNASITIVTLRLSPLTTALAVATGGLVGPLLIKGFGFVESAPVQTQSALWAIAGGYALLPIVLKIIAISLSWRFPITATKQAQIQRILTARRDRNHHAL